MSKGRPSNLKIKGDKLREVIEQNALGLEDISKFVLGKNEKYLRDSCRKNDMNAEAYNILCDFLKLDTSEYIYMEEAPKKDLTLSNNEDVVVGINSTFNKVNEILAEIKVQQTLTREQINVEKQILEVLKQINTNLGVNTEKVKAIFTEVKYKKWEEQ